MTRMDGNEYSACYRSAALRRKKRTVEDEAGTALVPEGARGNVAGLAPARSSVARREKSKSAVFTTGGVRTSAVPSAAKAMPRSGGLVNAPVGLSKA